ncbi:unnamed protein product, partial [Porites evermanni]
MRNEQCLQEITGKIYINHKYVPYRLKVSWIHELVLKGFTGDVTNESRSLSSQRNVSVQVVTGLLGIRRKTFGRCKVDFSATFPLASPLSDHE